MSKHKDARCEKCRTDGTSLLMQAASPFYTCANSQCSLHIPVSCAGAPMTRQMADDEVLRPEVVAWAVTKGERRHFYPGANDPREVHDNGGQHDPLITLASHNAAVAALQAERDALREAAIGATDKLQAERIEARELRKQRLSWINHVESVGCTYVATIGLEGEPVEALVNTRAERAESALEALRGQVAGLVRTFQSDADCSGLAAGYRMACRHHAIALEELLAIKERMG